MTTTEPRVLITAIKCQKCGKTMPDWFTINGIPAHLPMVADAGRARALTRDNTHILCGGDLLIATEPVPSAARLSGCFGWMNKLGFDDLDEFLEDAE